MIIDCVSDLFGNFPILEGGDLLIIAGNLTAHDELDQYLKFNHWFISQKYTKKIIISGNHDNLIEKGFVVNLDDNSRQSLIPIFPFNATYLQDTGESFKGFNIWGSPWIKSSSGLLKHSKAFVVESDSQLEQKWEEIPDDTNILITRCPVYGVFDDIYDFVKNDTVNMGSISLRKKILSMPSLKLHVCGHIHEHGGKQIKTSLAIFANASYVNEKYKPIHNIIRVELCENHT